MGVALSYRIASGGPILDQGWWLLALITIWWVVFAAGAACVLRWSGRFGMALVVVVAVALRIAALAGAPVLSDDVYRYAWDGRVQAAGVNPYRYPPDAAELAGLREPWLWPDEEGCAELDRPPGCSRMNRIGEPTIYPPVGQLWFWAGHSIHLSDLRDRGWQALAMAVDLSLIAVLALALRSWGREPTAVVLYAWSPIAVLESAQGAHVDALAVIAVVGALWAARRERPVLGGVLLAIATLIKLYPALLLPVLLRRHPQRTSVAFLATLALAYAPHVATLGLDVLGYLPDYLAEEGYSEGNRFLLVGLTGASGLVAQVVVGVGLVVAAWRAWASDDPPEVPAAMLLGVALLLATPVQPWYALLLVAIATLGRAWWWLPVAAGGYPVYFAAILDGPEALAGRLGYGLAALMVVMGLWLHRRDEGEHPVQSGMAERARLP